jgi:heme exporter protein CcmD
MNPKHAIFIWGSYGLTLVVLLWNSLAPQLRRSELRRRLSESEPAAEDEA